MTSRSQNETIAYRDDSLQSLESTLAVRIELPMNIDPRERDQVRRESRSGSTHLDPRHWQK